jgi:hypothetical protein
MANRNRSIPGEALSMPYGVTSEGMKLYQLSETVESDGDLFTATSEEKLILPIELLSSNDFVEALFANDVI